MYRGELEAKRIQRFLNSPYSKIEVSFPYEKPLLQLYHPEPLNMGTPFQPFTQREMSLLLSRLFSVMKWFKLRDIQGDLHIDYYTDVGNSVWSETSTLTPWLTRPLRFEDEVDFPYSLGMCFNNTARRTPIFELTYPDAIHKQFLGLVSDWDVIGDTYDATQLIYKPDNLQPVEVRIPRDIVKLSSLRVVARPNFVDYPQMYE